MAIAMTQSDYESKIMMVLQQAGFVNNCKICDTMQGQIWRSIQINSNFPVVIKVTSKHLHKNGLIVVDGKKIAVDENILREKEILQHLTTTIKTASIVKYFGFFKSNTNYYLVMENGGSSLFNFINRAHKIIQIGKIDVNEWIKVVRVVFKQLLYAIDELHGINICHFDISLENVLINDVKIEIQNANQENEKIRFSHNDVRVKLCDFGLAEMFCATSDDDDKLIGKKEISFESTKFCGKLNYESPEIINKKPFNAKSNDTWCLGICLFMMLSGGSPWFKASSENEAFRAVMNGKLEFVLREWNRLQYFTPDSIDLLSSILQYENKRISIQEIKKHRWLK